MLYKLYDVNFVLNLHLAFIVIAIATICSFWKVFTQPSPP